MSHDDLMHVLCMTSDWQARGVMHFVMVCYVFCAGPVIDKRMVSCVSKLEQTQWLDALRKQANYGAKKSPKPQRLQVSRNKMYLMFCCTTELYLHVCEIWFYYVSGKALLNDSFNILIAYCTKAECFVTLHIHFTPNWIECGQLGSAVVPCLLKPTCQLLKSCALGQMLSDEVDDTL